MARKRHQLPVGVSPTAAALLLLLSLPLRSSAFGGAATARAPSRSMYSAEGSFASNPAVFSLGDRGVRHVPRSYLTSPSRSSRRAATRLCSQTPTAADSDVVELQYSEFKPPSAESSHPPVIFLHGLLGNKRNFASLASSLSTQIKQPRSIYALDLRNHGENTHDWRGTMSYSEMARDVLAFMDKVAVLTGHENAVIVGHSMGGKVAQALALMHPSRVAGLVVLDIAPVRYYSDGDKAAGDGSGWKAVEEIVRSVASIDLEGGGYATKRDVDAALRGGTLQDPALRAFVLTNLDQPRKIEEGEPPLRWKVHWDGIVDQLDSIAGFDVHDQAADDSVAEEESESEKVLSQYEGDVFFIHGGASRFVRHSHMSTIAGFFPNHMLTTIRGVGHWVHAEAPDDTIALLKRYLDR